MRGGRRGEIAPLLRFRSSAAEGWTSLPDYVSRMKDGQEAIYYLVADDAEALKSSPQLEGFKARGLEVLLLSDHVDAFWPDQLGTFEEKPLRSITKCGLDLSKFASDGEQPAAPEGIDAFVAAVKTALGEEVADVRVTDRLVDSAVVLSAGGAGPDLQMQRLLRRAGRTIARPALECYELLVDPATPHQVRVTVLAALTYLLLPLDLIPDFIPAAGFSDDLVALTALLGLCTRHISPEIRARAQRRLDQWFPVNR